MTLSSTTLADLDADIEQVTRNMERTDEERAQLVRDRTEVMSYVKRSDSLEPPRNWLASVDQSLDELVTGINRYRQTLALLHAQRAALLRAESAQRALAATSHARSRARVRCTVPRNRHVRARRVVRVAAKTVAATADPDSEPPSARREAARRENNRFGSDGGSRDPQSEPNHAFRGAA